MSIETDSADVPWPAFVVGMVIVFAVGFTWGSCHGWSSQRDHMERQAVLEHVGHWVPGQDGRPQFEYIKP